MLKKLHAIREFQALQMTFNFSMNYGKYLQVVLGLVLGRWFKKTSNLRDPASHNSDLRQILGQTTKPDADRYKTAA